LGLINPYIDVGTGGYVGSLVGFLHGTIANCYVEGGSVSGDDKVGGLVGYNIGIISNCYSTGSVLGDERVGGLVGQNPGTIINSYSTSSVIGDDDVGGLVGLNGGTITNCYATGSVTGSSHLGGLCGDNEGSITITNCYFLDPIDGGGPDNGIGTPLTDAQMKQQNSFANWDFTDETANGTSEIWQVPTGGGYPVLSSFNGYIPVVLSGDGSEVSPYLINNAAELGAIYHYKSNVCFRLQSDIDLTGIKWSTAVLSVFGGCFDGNSHAIYNLNIEGGGYLGLFGKIIGSGAEVRGLGMVDVSVTGGDDPRYLGGLCGSNGGTISNCYSTGSVSGGDDSRNLGGLCGSNGGTITNCYSIGDVTGDRYVGGLVGLNGGTITNCYATGSVSGDWDVGGIVGWNEEGTITNCYATGSVSGDWDVGGIVGLNDEGTITNCYSTGNVLGGRYPGGLVGKNYRGTITDCNATGDVTGEDKVGGLVGENYSGTVTNCNATGDVKGEDKVGGLVGYNDKGTITNCYSTSSITGEDVVGGLVGANSDNGTINNCYSMSNVLGKYSIGGLMGFNGGAINNCYAIGIVVGDDRVGGLVACNREGKITNCYSTSSASGNQYVGGLVGENDGIIFNCYSTGSVSGTTDVGGLVGKSVEGIFFCYWDIETSRQAESAGGMGKTTVDMQMASTFVGWGCGSVWAIDEGVDYPRLWWESVPGELIAIPSYCDGSGEPNDPYLIYTAEQLNMIGLVPCHWDKHFKLMADIDMSGYMGTTFNTIGILVDLDSPGNRPFRGVFDGNGHTISNFTYTATEIDFIGLFVYIDDPNAEIKDVGLIDPNVDTGGWFVGSLVGYLGEGTINNCYVEGGNVSGGGVVGGLVGSVGYQYDDATGTITNCYSTCSVSGELWDIGGLLGYNSEGTISNCYSTGSVSGVSCVGGLVGHNYAGTTTYCYSTGSVSGDFGIGGLVGYNSEDTITNSYSTGSVTGTKDIGGLVGGNFGTINNCCATGSVTGWLDVGGLVGLNGRCDEEYCYGGTISNCYSTGSVSGDWSYVGGLVGENREGTITNCYSSGGVSGGDFVGGLVGFEYSGWPPTDLASFWDIETSGQTTSAGGTGKTTAEMQMQVTFTDAGWDFNTPVWTIYDGNDYPRLWWEYVPVLHAEPEITLGTSNRISWEPVVGDVEYYAECAEDENFTSIVYNSGWITETSCEFTGLQLDQRYWYSVKARNSAGIESQWSNVESSLQCSFSDVIETLLTPESLKNKNMKNALLNKIDEALEKIDEGLYKDALNKLQNDILQKTNGCGETGEPDKNDWIIACEEQSKVYPLIIGTIEHVRCLMEQSPD